MGQNIGEKGTPSGVDPARSEEAGTGGQECARIADRMERLPLTKKHYAVLAFIFFGWFTEAIDLGATGFLLPVIREAFELTRQEASYFTAIGFVGMFLGATAGGPLADRFGRKAMMWVPMAMTGVIGVLMGLAPTYTILFALRFCMGLMMGAQFPVALTYLSESVPSRFRAKSITFFQLLVPAGIALSGFITLAVLPHFSWQGVYFAEAIPNLGFIGVLLLCPESALWLESRGRHEQAQRICAQFEESARLKSPDGELPPCVVRPVRPTEPTRALFSRKYIGSFILSFCVWFFSMFNDYGLTTWLTTLLVEKGFDVVQSTAFVTIGILGGIPAYFVTSWLADKHGRKLSFLVGGIATCVFAVLYGMSVTIPMLLIFGALYQFGKYMNAMNCAIYTPELYDTSIRAAGTSLATASGRLGAITGPIALAAVLSALGPNATFYAAAVAAVIPGVLVFIFGPETKGKMF